MPHRCQSPARYIRSAQTHPTMAGAAYYRAHRFSPDGLTVACAHGRRPAFTRPPPPQVSTEACRPPQTSLRSTRLTPREARGYKRAIRHPARSRHRCRPSRRPRPRDPRLTSVKDSRLSRRGWRRRYYAVNLWRCTNSS